MNKIIDNPQQIQQAEDCIKSASHFWGEYYHNICDGTYYFVAFGFWDFVLTGVLLVLWVVLMVFIIRLLVDL